MIKSEIFASVLLMSAVNGNGQDLKTLAANLNCDFNQLQTAVCSVRSAIDQVAGPPRDKADPEVYRRFGAGADGAAAGLFP